MPLRERKQPSRRLSRRMQESENQASVDEPEPSEPGSTEPNFDGTTGKPYLGNLIGFFTDYRNPQASVSTRSNTFTRWHDKQRTMMRTIQMRTRMRMTNNRYTVMLATFTEGTRLREGVIALRICRRRMRTHPLHLRKPVSRSN